MDGLFIFDGSNDLIFEKLNDQIKEKLLDSAQKQGLLDPVSYFYILTKHLLSEINEFFFSSLVRASLTLITI